MDYVFAALIGLIMGGLPTGRAVGFIANDPVLAAGTGNSGALLWLKQGRLGVALLAFALEAGKIIAAMQIAWLLTFSYPPLLVAGLVAVGAHGYSPYLHFRPCRTFSVFLGFALAAHVWSGVILTLLWFGLFMLTLRQYRATAYVLAAYPVVLYVFKGYEAGFAAVLLLVYALWHYRRGLWHVFKKTEMPWPKAALLKTLKEHRL